MSNYMAELSAALNAWLTSQDRGSAGVRMVDLQLRDHYDEQPPVEVELQELTADNLRYVLAVDAAAAQPDGVPTAHHHDEVEAGDELRFAAARLERLTNPFGFIRESDLGWPSTAAAVLTEIARASSALQTLVGEGTEKIIQGLRRGSLVALPHGDGPRSIPDQAAIANDQAQLAAAAADLLGQASAAVTALAEQVAALRVTSTATGEGAVDGSTLVQEAILLITLRGSFNEGRYHARVFQPRQGNRLVLISQLADNHSGSITNRVEILAKTIAAAMLDGAASEEVNWALVYPDGLFGESRGTLQEVRFNGLFTRPGFGGLTQDRLETLAGGPVKRWHTSNYTLPLLTGAGVPVLTPEVPGR